VGGGRLPNLGGGSDWRELVGRNPAQAGITSGYAVIWAQSPKLTGWITSIVSQLRDLVERWPREPPVVDCTRIPSRMGTLLMGKQEPTS
jgi:hypothetical protein